MSNNTLSNVREKMRQNSEDRRRDFEKYKERALQIRLIEMSSSSGKKESNDSKANSNQSQKSHRSRSVSSERYLKTRLVDLSETNNIINKKVVPPEGNQKCKMCGKSFTLWSMMMDHVNSIHNAKPQKDKKLCVHCGTYIHIDKLKKHIKEVHYEEQQLQQNHKVEVQKKSLKCNYCGMSFLQKSNLSQHILTVHNRVGKDGECFQCGEKFYHAIELRKHIVDVHGGKKFQKRDYPVHERKKDHECDYCGKPFYQSDNLEKHIDAVHKRPKDHKCDFCGKSFFQIDNLKRHISSIHQSPKEGQNVHEDHENQILEARSSESDSNHSSENWMEEKKHLLSKLKKYKEKFENFSKLKNDYDELSTTFWQSRDLNALFESKLKEEEEKNAKEKKEFSKKLEDKNHEIECLKKDSMKLNSKDDIAYKIKVNFESKLAEEQLIKRLENRNQEIEYLNKNSIELHQVLHQEKVKNGNLMKELENKTKECLKKDEQILELKATCVCQFDQIIDKVSVKREFQSGIKMEIE